jgi:ATP-binding cassette subfamily B protein
MPATTHDVSAAGEAGENQPEETTKPGNAWSDRLRALRNVPPVLKFVWESGPTVVFWNIAIRLLVALLPVGIGIVGRFIIDGVNEIRLHKPLPQHFWWLVGAEMALAVTTGRPPPLTSPFTRTRSSMIAWSELAYRPLTAWP